MRCLMLLVVFAAGCSASVAAPVPVAATKAVVAESPPVEAAPAPKSSIVYGPALGAPPSGWQITISGGPTYVLAGPPQVIRVPHPTRTPPFALEYFWSHVAGPTAFSVYVDENNRMRLTGNEFSRSQSWGGIGPMASWSNVPCHGSWVGHTLDINPL